MPVIPLATRSQHVDFAYDQVVRPHRSYRPSGGLPRGKPRTRHMWICLQLSGARGVDNGGVKGNVHLPANLCGCLECFLCDCSFIGEILMMYRLRNCYSCTCCTLTDKQCSWNHIYSYLDGKYGLFHEC